MLKSILRHNLKGGAIRNSLAAVWSTSARNVGSSSSPTSHQRSLESCKQPGTPPGYPPFLVANNSRLMPQCSDSIATLLSRLSLSPEEAAATIKYRLPSKSPASETAILDPVASVAIPWDCPTAVNQDFVDVPSSQHVNVIIEDPMSDSSVSKKASNILQKRHKKMKRHQYKKWRKRNLFKLRAQRQKRRKKQKERWVRHLNRFRFTDLKASEGEEYLQKKQEKFNIYLRYLGVEVDDSLSERKADGGEGGKKKHLGCTAIISPEGTGRMVPAPILPQGVPQR